jgi:ketosteroid isomerase-like protein
MNRDEQEIRQLVATWMEATKKEDLQTSLRAMRTCWLRSM